MACPHKEPQKKWGFTSLRESFLMKHTNLRNLHQKIKTPCFHLPVNLEAQKWKSLFLKPGEANKNLLQWELPDTDFMGRTTRTEEHLRPPPEASSEGSSASRSGATRFQLPTQPPRHLGAGDLCPQGALRPVVSVSSVKALRVHLAACPAGAGAGDGHPRRSSGAPFPRPGPDPPQPRELLLSPALLPTLGCRCLLSSLESLEGKANVTRTGLMQRPRVPMAGFPEASP